MKKNVSLLFFFAIAAIVLMASYRTKNDTSLSPSHLLTIHAWKFVKAESLNDGAANLVNTIYYDAQYNFTTQRTYQGEFFDHPIQGRWSLSGNNELVLDEGTTKEEHLEIIELTENLLMIRVTEKGSVVTLFYE
jgi:hypothetical protein